MLQNPENSDDRWIPDAATSAAAKNDAWLPKAVLSSYKPALQSSQASQSESQSNLISNPSFEKVQDGIPAGWHTVNYSGRAQLTLGEGGHSGSHSVKISSEQGADASWSVQVPVK